MGEREASRSTRENSPVGSWPIREIVIAGVASALIFAFQEALQLFYDLARWKAGLPVQSVLPERGAPWPPEQVGIEGGGGHNEPES